MNRAEPRLFEGGSFPPREEATVSLQEGRSVALGILAEETDSGSLRLRVALFRGVRSAAFTPVDEPGEAGRTYVLDPGPWLEDELGPARGDAEELRHFRLVFSETQFECLARTVSFEDLEVEPEGMVSALRARVHAVENGELWPAPRGKASVAPRAS